MKKLKQTFFLVVAACTMMACNKNNYENDMLGKWNYNLVTTITYDGDDIDIHNEQYEHLCVNQKDYVSFLTDGVVHSAEFNEDCDISDNVGTWSLKGDVITITYNGVESFKGTIDILEDGILSVRDDNQSTETVEYYIEFVKVNN